MTKRVKKLVCLLLTVVLLVSLMAPIVMADNQTTASSEKHDYTFIGDSIATGFSLRYADEDYWSPELTIDYQGVVFWKRPMGMHQKVLDAYPSLVGETLGINSSAENEAYYNNLARCGMRTVEVLRFLDPDYEEQMKDDEIGNNYILSESGHTGMTASELQEMYDNAVDYVSQAKLITLQIGSNDITLGLTLTGPLYLQKILDQEEKTISIRAIEEATKKVFSAGGDASSILVTAIETAESIGALPETIAAYGYALTSGLTTYISNMKKLVDRIYEINPDVTLCVLGLYNPLKELNITDAGILKAGFILDSGVSLMNTYVENLYATNSKYDYRYVDVTDMELNGFSQSLVDYITSGELENLNMENTAQIHPGQAGHQYIANQILDVLGDDFSLGIPDDGNANSGWNDVTTNNSTMGTVSANVRTAYEGDTVTVTVTPNSGYSVDKVYYKDENNEEVEITKDSNGQYTFRMPSYKVVIAAKFSGNGTEKLGEFTDVKESDWYFSAVNYVLQKGYMVGTSSTTFSPNGQLTRAMVAQILYAIASKPTVESSAGFTDVSSGDWYAAAVNWAASRGIVSGYGDGRFGPNDYVTREQLATMLRSFAVYKNAKSDASGDLSSFTDAENISSWAVDNVKWAVGNGIISGKGNGIIDPQGTATRAEMAQMVYKFMTTLVDDSY